MSSPPDVSFREPAPGGDRLAQVTAVLSIIFGGLELLFALFAILGMATGGLMSVTKLPGGQEGMGPLIIIVYALFFVGALTAGVLHLVSGIQLFKAEPNRSLIWAGLVGSIGSVLTIYCAPFGITTAILMLVWLTRPEPGEDEPL